MVVSAAPTARVVVHGDEQMDGTWLARELHDGVVQCLTTTLISLELLRRDTEPAHAAGRLAVVEADVRAGLTEVRELVSRLRGAPSTDHGLVESIEAMLRELTSRSTTHVELVVEPAWPGELPVEVARQLRRIVQEALANVRLHAAASKVRVALEVMADDLRVTIADDGRWHRGDGSTPTGLGIIGMRERAALLGGSLEIESTQGAGTTVVVTVGRRLLGVVEERS